MAQTLFHFVVFVEFINYCFNGVLREPPFQENFSNFELLSNALWT